MLESSYGLTFFLKTPRKPKDIRMIYVRVTVDGKPKEASTNQKWDIKRWDQKTERAIGSKEDARVLNSYLDLLGSKIVQYKTELIGNGRAITAEKLLGCITGKNNRTNTLIQEFLEHNSEIEALAQKGEMAPATAKRFRTALGHVKEFMGYKYNVDDIDFRDLDFSFIKDYDFFLRTVRNCNNNTTLKYITNFRKIVFRALDKEIIKTDPFKRFKRKLTKPSKKPLTSNQLHILENRVFSSERLSIVRDIFIFQCYTGLAYIDVFQLRKSDIQRGIDGELWIISDRQKTKAATKIPLLPKAIQIMKRYENDPLCIRRQSVLPVRSNQKCNEYLKEIATLCNFDIELNTHKARRTFASTVTLKNGVPMNIVKEMLGHSSILQTEEYAITEEISVGVEMKQLGNKLLVTGDCTESPEEMLRRIKVELAELERNLFAPNYTNMTEISVLREIESQMSQLRIRMEQFRA